MKLVLFLPLVFLAAALPIAIAHLGTSQAAWLLFFSANAPGPKILAYSLAAHFTFMFCNGSSRQSHRDMQYLGGPRSSSHSIDKSRSEREGMQMREAPRGAMLSTFTVLFAILALSNLLKPFHLDPNAGFVFFGMKTHGVANAILGPAFGILLVAYAIGIWRMRRWVLPIAYAYSAYVVVNLLLFSIRNNGTARQSPPFFIIVYIAIAIGVSAGSAILLYGRRRELI